MKKVRILLICGIGIMQAMQNSGAVHSGRERAGALSFSSGLGLAGVLAVGTSKVITAASAHNISIPSVVQQHHVVLNLAGWAGVGAALGYKGWKEIMWRVYCRREATLFEENKSFSGKWDLYYVDENKKIQCASRTEKIITIGDSVRKSKQRETLFSQVECDYYNAFNQEFSKSSLRYGVAYATSILGAIGLASLAHKLGW